MFILAHACFVAIPPSAPSAGSQYAAAATSPTAAVLIADPVADPVADDSRRFELVGNYNKVSVFTEKMLRNSLNPLRPSIIAAIDGQFFYHSSTVN